MDCMMQVCVNMTGTLLKVRVDFYSDGKCFLLPVTTYGEMLMCAQHSKTIYLWNRYYVLTDFCI